MQLVKKNVALLDAYVPGHQPPRGECVIKLNTNENPYPPSHEVQKALLASMEAFEDLRLYPQPDSGSLRKEIAGAYGVKPENVFCGNGSDEIIALVFRTFVEADDLVLFPNPTYGLYKVQAQLHNVRHQAVETDENFNVRPAAYLAFPARVVFIANPNPPAGTLLLVEDLAQMAGRLPGLLVIDEAYIDFGGESALGLIERYPNVLVLRTFSKSFSLCSIRVGYAFGDRELISALDKVRDSYNISFLSQVAAIAAIRDLGHMEENARRITAGREYLQKGLLRLDFKVFPSSGNFLLAAHPRVAAPLIYSRLAARKIYVRHFDGPRVFNCLRISVGTLEQMDRLLWALEDITRC